MTMPKQTKEHPLALDRKRPVQYSAVRGFCITYISSAGMSGHVMLRCQSYEQIRRRLYLLKCECSFTPDPSGSYTDL